MKKHLEHPSVKEQVFNDVDPTLEIIPKEEFSGYPFVRIVFSYFFGGTFLGFLLGLGYCWQTLGSVIGESGQGSRIYIDVLTMIPVGFVSFFIPAIVLLWVVYWTRWTRSLNTAVYSGLIGGALMAIQIYIYSLMIGKNELDQTIRTVSIDSMDYWLLFCLYAVMSGAVAYFAYPRHNRLNTM